VTYAATIAWGDGSTTPGTVIAAPTGGFEVRGGHTYAEQGSFAGGVTITNAGLGVVVGLDAAVADAPLRAAGLTQTATAGTPFTATVATFTDVQPELTNEAGTPLGDYSATVDWGDGSSLGRFNLGVSDGTVAVAFRSGQAFDVTGSHAYLTPGVFTVTVTVNDNGGSSAQAQSLVTVEGVALTAYRTGGLLGNAVSSDIKRSGDPTKYLVLVNDDYDSNLASGLPDNTAATASLPSGGVGGGGDRDLARITLKALPGLSSGMVSVILSQPGSVRLFRSDGTLLFADGQTGTGGLAVDLAQPSGYLAGLRSGNVDVWVEGMRKDSDFSFTVTYAKSGRVVSQDSVHMLIVDWTFRGMDGGQVLEVTPVWKQALMAGVRRAVGLGTPTRITADPEGYFFKNQIDGLPSGLVTRLRVTSDSNASDFYDDQLQDSPNQSVSTRFAALYSPDRIYLAAPDATVTASERAAIRQQLGLNVVHNRGQKARVSTGPAAQPTDILERDFSASKIVKISLNQNVLHVGDHVMGSVSVPDGEPNWYLSVGTSDGRIIESVDPTNGGPLPFDFVVNTEGLFLVRGTGTKFRAFKGDRTEWH